MVPRLLKSRLSIRTNPLGDEAEVIGPVLNVAHSALGERMRHLRDLRYEGRITDAEYAVEAAAVLHGTSSLGDR